MVKILSLSFIPGFMVGCEWDYINGTIVVDLGVVRIMYDYVGYEVDAATEEETTPPAS